MHDDKECHKFQPQYSTHTHTHKLCTRIKKKNCNFLSSCVGNTFLSHTDILFEINKNPKRGKQTHKQKKNLSDIIDEFYSLI